MSTSPEPRELRPSSPGGAGVLVIELDGAGGHPAAWRATRTAPAAVLTPGRLRELVLAAESAGFHAATFSDAPHAGGRRRPAGRMPPHGSTPCSAPPLPAPSRTPSR